MHIKSWVGDGGRRTQQVLLLPVTVVTHSTKLGSYNLEKHLLVFLPFMPSYSIVNIRDHFWGAETLDPYLHVFMYCAAATRLADRITAWISRHTCVPINLPVHVGPILCWMFFIIFNWCYIPWTGMSTSLEESMLSLLRFDFEDFLCAIICNIRKR